MTVIMTKPIGILFSSFLLASRSPSTRSFSPPSLTSSHHLVLHRSSYMSSSSRGRSSHTKTATALLDTNPLRTLFQNFQKRDISTALSSQQLSHLTSLTASLASPPSWDEIRSTLTSQQTPQEREFRSNLSKGIGVGSPLHTLRLYDENNREEDVRVTLFRDSASWCPYCQKVSFPTNSSLLRFCSEIIRHLTYTHPCTIDLSCPLERSLRVRSGSHWNKNAYPTASPRLT